MGLWISWVDLKRRQVPNGLLISLGILILVGTVTNTFLVPHFIAAGLTFALLYAVVVFFLYRKQSLILGGGDLKLMPLLAFALGLHNLPVFFVLSGIMGLLGVWTKTSTSAVFPGLAPGSHSVVLVPRVKPEGFSKNVQTPFAPFLFAAFFLTQLLDRLYAS
ncbi:MAG: A24 family peptidase [Alphaproteobacteria bacterium]